MTNHQEADQEVLAPTEEQTVLTRLRLDTAVLSKAAWQAYVAFGQGEKSLGAPVWEFVAVAVVAAMIRTHRLVPKERVQR